jgi:hypothetical protein
MSRTTKFVKLRNGEELVALVEEFPNNVILEKPVSFTIDNFFEDGKQLINFRDWLPASMVKVNEVALPATEVMFTLEVSEDFAEYYVSVCDYLFNTKPIKKNKKISTDDENKIISMAEAIANMIDKKDKPVH